MYKPETEAPIHGECGIPSLTPTGAGDWHHCVPCGSNFSPKNEAEKAKKVMVEVSPQGDNIKYLEALSA